MTTTLNLPRPAAGLNAGRGWRTAATSPAVSLTRAGLPVVSNRAFISAWANRRGKSSAASATANLTHGAP
jgi:hypothetical protein